MKIQIRKAVVEDAKGIAKVHIDSWRSTYKGIVSDDFLEKLNMESKMEHWREIIGKPVDEYQVFVAKGEKKIMGFIDGGKNREDTDGYDAELYAFYLLEEAQKKGIGREMLRKLAEELRSGGFSSLIVWVLKDNPSRIFYEKMGGVYVGTKLLQELSVEEIAYGWKDIRVLIEKGTKS